MKKYLTKEMIMTVLPYVILLIALIVLSKKMKSLFSFGQGDEETKKAANKYVSEVSGSIDKNELSYDNSVYLAFANAIHGAVKGFGTDEKTILDTFKQLKTNSDFKALVRAYAVRDSMDLVQTLYDELPTTFNVLDYVLKSPLYTLGGNVSIEQLNEVMKSNGLTIII